MKSEELVETIDCFRETLLPGREIIYDWLEECPIRHQNKVIRKYPTLTKVVDGKEVARKDSGIDLVSLVAFTKEH
jgi:hypothetical protein